MKRVYAFLVLLSACCVSFRTTAQEGWRQLTMEAIYHQARNEAFAKKYDTAQQMLQFVLDKNERYHDARVLLARLYAWRNEYDAARKELRYVLKLSPAEHDAFEALSDVEWWQGRYDSLLTVTITALRSYPGEEAFILKRARAEHALGKHEDALSTLNQLLTLNPAHEGAISLLNEIKSDRMRFVAAIQYGFDSFEKYFKTANYWSLQISRITPRGTAVLRENFSSRVGMNGLQTELDLYPKISKLFYGYFNYGISSSVLFPKHRIGAELYGKMPAHLEVSGGMRYLYFNSSSNVIIYTGSLGWYVRKFLAGFREYISYGAAGGTGFTHQFSLRLYPNGNRDLYWGVRLNSGFSPDERRIQTVNGYTSASIYNLKAKSLAADISVPIKRNFIAMLTAMIGKQQFVFSEAEWVRIENFTFTVKKRF